jgi:hypothetical protein
MRREAREDAMEIIDPLVLDLVEWVAPRPRPYAEVIEAWRTSCPRLTVWEDALDRGLLARRSGVGGTTIEVTSAGRAYLTAHGRASACAADVTASTSVSVRRGG